MKAADIERLDLTAEEKRRLLAELLRERARAWTGDHELSVGQEALWALQQVSPRSAAYNFSVAFRFVSNVDLEALRRAVGRVQERHAVLRTTYPVGLRGPVARVARDRPLDFEVIDVHSTDPAEVEARLAAEAGRPFDLAADPVMRVRVLHDSAGGTYLLLACHHISVDFWSGILIMLDLGAYYAAERTGVEAELPELKLEYRDFAGWQRRMLEGDEGRGLWEYWKNALAGPVPVLELPYDFPRARVATTDGAAHEFSFDEELSRHIKQVARQHEVTPFVVLLAGFQALLSRYSGQNDIWIGSPTAGRVKSGLQHVVGYFANPVVLRADLSGDPSLAELLEQQRVRVRGALSHQAMPFAKIVERLGLIREPSRSPLFDAMFTLQSVNRIARKGALQRARASNPLGEADATALRRAGARVMLGELALEVILLPPSGAVFDLDLEMVELNDSFTGKLTFSTGLFERRSIAAMAEHYRRLLAAGAENPATPLSRLDLLGDAGRAEVRGWGEGRRTSDDGRTCVHDLFEASAAVRPDAPAVITAGGARSFRDVGAQADRIAAGLRAAGVRPTERVAICCERPLHGLLGILGALKAGAAYVPLAPRDPFERQRRMMEESAARAVLVDTADADGLGGGSIPALSVPDLVRAGQPGPERTPSGEVTADDLAYILYTSGSSGAPKGVMLSHAAVVNHNRAAARLFDLRAADRVLLLGPFGSDITVEQMFPTWLAGGSVLVRDDYAAPSWDELRRLVTDGGVTVLNLPTSYWHAWVRELVETGQSVPPGLRLVILGGEAALRERYEEWRAVGGDGVRLINTYGPTEAAVIATAFEITPAWADAHPRRRIPIGAPIDNVDVCVVDRRGRLEAPGIPGELCIGGAGVGRGYVNAPELTAERFVTDMPVEQPGRRMYRTGDRVRWLSDGTIEFLGRTDAQVKVGGYRIEPAEIEAALSACAGVADAAVVPFDAGPGQTRLAAYVVTTDESRPDEGALREHLRQTLPDYMIPAVFTRLPAIPRLAMGKVDRRSLPAPRPSERADVVPYEAPSTPTEQTLADVWKLVLNLPRVGVNDNFFALGGDSILSIQVASRAAAAGMHITPRQVFEHPTIAELAKAGSQGGVQAEQGVVTGEAPLSPGQAWFFDTILEDRNQFNHTIRLLPRESIDPDRLKRAVDKLLWHHDTLRLRFEESAGGWRQVFAPYHPAEVDEVFRRADLREVPDDGLDAAMAECAAQAHAGIDIAYGPLLRVVWLDTGGRRDRVLWTNHLIAIDGVSWRFLVEDLMLAYHQAREGPILLPPKTTSYRAWSQRIAAYARSDELAGEIDFWRRMASASAPLLPRDNPDGRNLVSSARTIRAKLEAEESHILLHDVATACSVDVQDLLVTAALRALGRWMGRSDLTLQLYGHGRELPFDDMDVSRTVGWFTACYPVHFELSGQEGAIDALLSVKQRLREVPQHGANYRMIRYLRREPTIPALRSETCFNYLGRMDVALPPGVPFAPIPEESGPVVSGRTERLYVLELTAAISGGRVEAAFTYSGNIHRDETIASLARSFVEELRAMIRGYLDAPGARRKIAADPVAPSLLAATSAALGLFDGIDTDQLARRAVLPDDIRPITNPKPVGESGAVLLTGATGFLGAHLLRELLDRLNGRVYCLVRGDDPAAAHARVSSALHRFGLLAGADLSRVVCVCGHLDRPLLGLSAEAFADLAARVDAIYHNGALVNFLHNYDRLKAANVDGTIEILRLTARGRAKSLHYVSTLSVFPAIALEERPPFNESATLNHGGILAGGYAQTKWVAERLVREAGERGLVGTIHRVGRVGGHSRTGASGADDLMPALLRSCVTLGAAPRLDFEIELAPVDFVARAIVGLSGRIEPGQRTYHLSNPQSTSLDVLLDMVRASGKHIETVSPEEWLASLQKLLRETRDASILPLGALMPASVPPEFLLAALRRTRFDCGQTTAALAGLGIHCPPADESLLAPYVSGMLAEETVIEP